MKNFLHQFLTALKEEMDRLGIREKVYFHISDEPQMTQIDSYRAAKQVVAEDLEGCIVFDALSDYDFYKEGLVSQPVCALNHMEPIFRRPTGKVMGDITVLDSMKMYQIVSLYSLDIGQES